MLVAVVSGSDTGYHLCGGETTTQILDKKVLNFFSAGIVPEMLLDITFFLEQILSTLVFFFCVDAKNEIRLPAHLHNMWPLLIAISLSFVQRGLPMTQFGWVQMQFRSLNVIFKPAKMKKEPLRLWICNHFTPELQKFNLHSFFGRNRKKNELNFYSIIVSFILYFFCLAFNATGEIPGSSICRQDLCHWSGGAGVSYWSHFVLTIRQRMHLAEKIDTKKKIRGLLRPKWNGIALQQKKNDENQPKKEIMNEMVSDG